uniref:Uncharacterized protein n=1 Tax=Pyxicephalus adspersus TaxID=30357 RepID=A0AAV3B0T1_PYXAD|nr:TPA: hypothetical protein GDO54_009038 [Pyxicephalus adspersus]
MVQIITIIRPQQHIKAAHGEGLYSACTQLAVKGNCMPEAHYNIRPWTPPAAINVVSYVTSSTLLPVHISLLLHTKLFYLGWKCLPKLSESILISSCALIFPINFLQ